MLRVSWKVIVLATKRKGRRERQLERMRRESALLAELHLEMPETARVEKRLKRDTANRYVFVTSGRGSASAPIERPAGARVKGTQFEGRIVR